MQIFLKVSAIIFIKIYFHKKSDFFGSFKKFYAESKTMN